MQHDSLFGQVKLNHGMGKKNICISKDLMTNYRSIDASLDIEISVLV
jgi:hypothetical protein